MSKYRLLRERIQQSSEFAGCQLLVPPAATDDELRLVHDAEYVTRVADGELSPVEIRRIGFPWSPGMVQRSRRSVGASIQAAWQAMEQGISVNLAGGTHHAFPDAGQGYCVFNDAAVAARTLQRAGRAERVLFIDCDVHQGNGTASIAKHDASLFAFSMHCDQNFPFRKTNGDLDISLPAGATDGPYLQALVTALKSIAARFEPQIAFYLAGADPFSGDRLGKLNVSKQGLRIRDEIVFQYCTQRQIPVAVTMAGGYAPNVDDIVDIHYRTVHAAKTWFNRVQTSTVNTDGDRWGLD